MKCFISNSDGTECIKCHKGYVLNNDKKCDKIETYDCEDIGYFFDMDNQID